MHFQVELTEMERPTDTANGRRIEERDSLVDYVRCSRHDFLRNIFMVV
jgi:hypothetical protein